MTLIPRTILQAQHPETLERYATLSLAGWTIARSSSSFDRYTYYGLAPDGRHHNLGFSMMSAVNRAWRIQEVRE